jgi:hypothetical protein
MSNENNTKAKKIITKIILTLFVCSGMIFVLLKEGDINNKEIGQSSENKAEIAFKEIKEN